MQNISGLDLKIKDSEGNIKDYSIKPIKVEKDGVLEHVGSYKKIYRLWEDEKVFYIGIGEDDLLVLPKANFEKGDVSEFRDFVLEKSRCVYTWKPARIDNVIKQLHKNMQMKATQFTLGARKEDK